MRFRSLLKCLLLCSYLQKEHFVPLHRSSLWSNLNNELFHKSFTDRILNAIFIHINISQCLLDNWHVLKFLLLNFYSSFIENYMCDLCNEATDGRKFGVIRVSFYTGLDKNCVSIWNELLQSAVGNVVLHQMLFLKYFFFFF